MAKLKKELSLLDVYAIATATTISGGFFLLPGLVAIKAGAAVPFVYLLAVIPLIPALLSMIELSTAMPKAGGLYYFLDRSMGPLVGTIGGLGTWLALSLKTAFALIGMGAYLELFFPQLPLQPLAIGFAVLFGFINLQGAKKTGFFQVILLYGLLLIIGWFSVGGIFQLELKHFSGFLDSGFNAIFGAAGMVVVSFVGLTKIASVAEEVKHPEKTIPLGIFLALGTVILVYEVGTFVMVGIIPPESLRGDMTPAATAAENINGAWGPALMTIAALLSFSAVANAGILSGSRYPLAMSRDHILPDFFQTLGKNLTPKNSINVTMGLIILCLILFDPTKLAKLASAFLLLIFALICLATIVMRESRIVSYDPGYRSPLYPWMHIFGIIVPLWLIVEMGWLPSLFILMLLGVGGAWYFYYARTKVVRNGAIYHVFAHLGDQHFEGLDFELRSLLREKGLQEQDAFDTIVANAGIIDITTKISYDEIVSKAAARFDERFSGKGELLAECFLEGMRIGAIPVSHGIALPHVRLPDLQKTELVIIRAHVGVTLDVNNELPGEQEAPQTVFAFFFLVSPEDKSGQHLHILAQIAGHADDDNFIKKWLSAKNEQTLKELILRDNSFLTLKIGSSRKTASLINDAIYDLNLPEGCLIALIHRDGKILMPRGSIELQAGDHLTIIGEPKSIWNLREEYSDQS